MSRVEELHRRAEAARHRPAAHGPDLDVDSFLAPLSRPPLDRLSDLSADLSDATSRVGMDTSEAELAGSFLLIDSSPVYSFVRRAYRGRLELMSITEARRRIPWLGDHWWRAVEVDRDKYTSAVHRHPAEGVFLHVFPGQRIEWPLQACFLLCRPSSRQVVHNVIVVDEGAELRILTGCTVHPDISSGLHVGVTEVFVNADATFSDTMIHSWPPGFHVRPRSGIELGSGATCQLNYILFDPARSVASTSILALEGEASRAEVHNIVLGRRDSTVDLDVHIELSGRGSRAESVSRAIALDRSRLFLRGALVGHDNESQGHLDCRGMSLSEEAEIQAIPRLDSDRAPGAELSHEAAVGPIDEDVVDYLMTRGLTRDEAIATLTRGFLRLELPGLPEALSQKIGQMIALTAEDAL